MYRNDQTDICNISICRSWLRYKPKIMLNLSVTFGSCTQQKMRIEIPYLQTKKSGVSRTSRIWICPSRGYATPYVCVIQHDRTFTRPTPVTETAQAKEECGKETADGRAMGAPYLFLLFDDSWQVVVVHSSGGTLHGCKDTLDTKFHNGVPERTSKIRSKVLQ